MGDQQSLATLSASPGHCANAFRLLRLGVLIVLSGAMSQALAQRPPAVVPTRPDTLIEKLPAGYRELMPVAGSTAPGASIVNAQRLLIAAARSGDSRLAARAEAMLSRLPSGDRRPAVLAARAFSAQHRHDFAAALKLLDVLVQQQPRDGDARLARAQIHLVQGNIGQARADCVALALGIDTSDGTVCAAALALRTGNYDAAATLAERWLAQAAIGDRTRRHVLVMRGEIAARAGKRGVDAWFRQALAIDSGDVRTLAAYARYLRSAGRDRELEDLLAGRDDNLSLLLQRTLAVYRIDPVRAEPLVNALGRRYALAHAVGSEPELREEAEFMLTLRGQPGAALSLAQRNFRTQRDVEDVDILRRAAIAARRPEALQPLQAWAASQRLSLPRINELPR